MPLTERCHCAIRTHSPAAHPSVWELPGDRSAIRRIGAAHDRLLAVIEPQDIDGATAAGHARRPNGGKPASSHEKGLRGWQGAGLVEAYKLRSTVCRALTSAREGVRFAGAGPCHASCGGASDCRAHKAPAHARPTPTHRSRRPLTSGEATAGSSTRAHAQELLSTERHSCCSAAASNRAIPTHHRIRSEQTTAWERISESPG